jgi:hydroxyacylglutathione hydrolase
LKKNNVKGLHLSKKPNHSVLMPFKDNGTFELGDRTITAVHVPGHTRGSVVYLDPKTHLMFTGDDVNPYLWLQLPGCTSLSEWLPGAETILKLADTYTPYCGHSTGLIKKEDIAKLIALGKEILAKKPPFKGKALDYPEDKNVYPRLIVARKGIK